MSPAPPRQLKPAPWPASDREAWEALFAEGDVLAGAGPARHWAPATRKGNGWRYARWLGWLAAGGLLDPDLSPGRARHARGRAGLRGGAAGGGRAQDRGLSYLASLKAVLGAMHPETDRRRLSDLVNRLNAWAEPWVDRGAALRPIEEIHAAGLREVDRLAARPAPVWRPRSRAGP